LVQSYATRSGGLALLLVPLSKAHPRATAVLVDEPIGDSIGDESDAFKQQTPRGPDFRSSLSATRCFATTS
jgi:hypothetical protein